MKSKQQIDHLYSSSRNKESIFLDAVTELRQRLYSGQKTPYNMVRKSAILRLLVIDGTRFYQDINKKYKLDLIIKLESQDFTGHSLSSADPSHSNYTIKLFNISNNGEEINIVNFLKLPIIRIDNSQLTDFIKKQQTESSKNKKENSLLKTEYDISSIIKLIANGLGGVHFSSWNNNQIPRQLMTDDSSPFNLNSNSKLHSIIDNLSIITLEMLAPLINVVENNLQSTAPISTEVSAIFSSSKKMNRH